MIRSSPRFLALLTSSALLCHLLFSQAQYRPRTIEEILRLPNDRINVGEAALVLAKDFYPDLNVESFLLVFGYMADRFNYHFGHISDPDQRVRAMNTYLYKKGFWNDSITFSYDEEDFHTTKLSNKFINGYVTTRKGSCITLPMMYLILGERLGYPIYATRLPYHFLVRYVPETPIRDFEENIEATNGGGYTPDTRYRIDFNVPEKAIANGVYLRTLSKKQYVASLCLINGNEWAARRDLVKAKRYFALAMKYDSTFTEAHNNYGFIHLFEARKLEERMWEEMQAVMETVDPLNLGNQVGSLTKEGSFKSEGSQYSRFTGSKNFMVDSAYSFRTSITNGSTGFETNGQTSVRMSNMLGRLQNSKHNEVLQARLEEIERRYEPLIRSILAVFRAYKKKSQDLGRVDGYPLFFFRNQSKELRKFQEKGEK